MTLYFFFSQNKVNIWDKTHKSLSSSASVREEPIKLSNASVQIELDFDFFVSSAKSCTDYVPKTVVDVI